MRFWPMWPFYLYLNSSFFKSTKSPWREPRLTFVTPSTPGFWLGMSIFDAVKRFCATPDPIVYFLVSPTQSSPVRSFAERPEAANESASR